MIEEMAPLLNLQFENHGLLGIVGSVSRRVLQREPYSTNIVRF